MTGKIVVYTQNDGALAVIIPAHAFLGDVQAAAAKLGETLTDAQLAVVACGKALSQASSGTDPVICDAADLPADRTFRGAWRRGGAAAVTIDMPAALTIARDRVRAARAPLLVALDADHTKAVGQQRPGDAEAIEAKRQALRDAPADARLATAKTAGALKAAMETVIAELEPAEGGT